MAFPYVHALYYAAEWKQLHNAEGWLVTCYYLQEDIFDELIVVDFPARLLWLWESDMHFEEAVVVGVDDGGLHFC